jgi:ABC-2 type transport system ATP-binding protein
MNEIIKTEALTKHYGKVKAVDGISLSVNKGEIYGFLGLNGAGKTTTIRMRLGMVRPTSGGSYLNGKKVHAGNHELWKNVGYLVEIPYSYPDLTVRENLEMIRRLRFIREPYAVDTVIEKLQLGPYHDRKAKNLSQGNAQRLGIAKAIIHNPDILLLDEPANGLDPAGIVEIREMLLDFALNKGVTIFIFSHILGEISRFATRIGIIHEGRLLQESNIEQLNRFRKRCLQVNTHNNSSAESKIAEKGFAVTISEGGFLEITTDKAITNPDIIATLLVQAGYPPTMLKVEEEDLESYFLRTISLAGGTKK